MKKHKKHHFNWTDGVLAVIGVCTIWFVHSAFDVMRETGIEPATIATAYFAFITAECAILWRIHESSKKRESKRDKTIADTNVEDINDIGEG